MGVEGRCVTSRPKREDQTPGSLHRLFSVPPRPAVFQHWLLRHPESWPEGAMTWSPHSWVGGTSEKRTLATELSGPCVTMALLTLMNGLSLGCLAQLSATRMEVPPLCGNSGREDGPLGPTAFVTLPGSARWCGEPFAHCTEDTYAKRQPLHFTCVSQPFCSWCQEAESAERNKRSDELAGVLLGGGRPPLS